MSDQQSDLQPQYLVVTHRTEKAAPSRLDHAEQWSRLLSLPIIAVVLTSFFTCWNQKQSEQREWFALGAKLVVDPHGDERMRLVGQDLMRQFSPIPVPSHGTAPATASPSASPAVNLVRSGEKFFQISDPAGNTRWTSYIDGVRPGDHVSYLFGLLIIPAGTKDVSVKVEFEYSKGDVTATGSVVAANVSGARGTARASWAAGYSQLMLRPLGAMIHTADTRSTVPIKRSGSDDIIALGDISRDTVFYITLEYEVGAE